MLQLEVCDKPMVQTLSSGVGKSRQACYPENDLPSEVLGYFDSWFTSPHFVRVYQIF
jgi:hypothetical protein